MDAHSFESQGRVGIRVETTSFAVRPGDSVTIPIILSNQGLEGDVLALSVDGIPSSWVYTSSASTLLTPGQEQEVLLTIQPPHSLQAGAGRHPFRIQVTSQAAPGQVFEVACILAIAAFAEFSSELRPQRVAAGEPARVTVENRGNIQQAFTLTCQSPDGTLSFEPGPSQELRVPPGEMAMAEFSAKPRSRPFFGGEVSFPFIARVQSADNVRNHNGEVVGRALIPGWLLAAVLLLIVAIACLSVALILWGGAPAGAPTEPPVVQPTDEVDQPVPTEPPPEQPTEPPSEQPTEPPPEQPPTEPPPSEPPPEQPTEEPTE